MPYCGFTVHGVHDTHVDLSKFEVSGNKTARLRDFSFEEARLASMLGGNALRVFYTNADACVPISQASLTMSLLPQKLHDGAWYALEPTHKIELIQTIAASIWKIADTLQAMDAMGNGLALGDLDAYLDGIRLFNDTQKDSAARIGVLLTNITPVPRPILECPADDVLAAHGIGFRFADIYWRYCQIHTLLARKLVHRYVAVSHEKRVVIGFEINNEPDYEWLPDEYRIENSDAPAVMAIRKYITELHLPQIPDVYCAVDYAEQTAWDGFQAQRGNWDNGAAQRIPVVDFPWGPKFDWYVSRYSEWAKHVSFAFFDERRSLGVKFEIVSAGVTHNNLDYLIRVHRADPEAFAYCDTIAFHPYHWPEHNIHDRNFRDRRDFSDWITQTPREFAAHYFKCFDFFKTFQTFIEDPDRRWPGFRNKKIWLTEFGIGSKLLGDYNSAHSEYVPFIRPKPVPAETLPAHTAVWEDLWEAFLVSVTPEYLRSLNVDGLFLYALREVGYQGLDKHDDDRTNFSLLDRFGQPRMERPVFDRLTRLVGGFAGRTDTIVADLLPLTPPWARWRSFSLALLRSQPWLGQPLPSPVTTAMSMLSLDEKRFLYWATAEYFQGRGAIVDAGCFVGGSTVAMAAGLADHWPEPEFKIHSFDRFVADDYMQMHYFQPAGLVSDGDRFRRLFDRNTERYASQIVVNDADIMTINWKGEVEILFLDICKAWNVNDHVVRTFFPRLVVGQSLVIQQDFFHNWEFWVIATMELLSDCFAFIAHVPLNTAVFRIVGPIDPARIPARLRDLGHEVLQGLLERHIDRYSNPFQRAMLITALACLHLDFGDREAACLAAERALGESSDHWVHVAIAEMGLAKSGVGLTNKPRPEECLHASEDVRSDRMAPRKAR